MKNWIKRTRFIKNGPEEGNWREENNPAEKDGERGELDFIQLEW